MKLGKLFATTLLGFLCVMTSAMAETNTAQIAKDSQAALANLYAKSPAAKALGAKAVAILVFPSITKAGLVIGGQYGEGAMIKGGKVEGYYTSTAGSVGLQAGAEKFSYAMFFMSEKILNEFKEAKGFEIGVGPTIVVMDAGAEKNLSSATAQADIYAYVFGQKGLMAGISIHGSKISKLEK